MNDTNDSTEAYLGFFFSQQSDMKGIIFSCGVLGRFFVHTSEYPILTRYSFLLSLLPGKLQKCDCNVGNAVQAIENSTQSPLETVRKPAEELLKACEELPGYTSVLAAIAGMMQPVYISARDRYDKCISNMRSNSECFVSERAIGMVKVYQHPFQL